MADMNYLNLKTWFIYWILGSWPLLNELAFVGSIVFLHDRLRKLTILNDLTCQFNLKYF